VTGRVGRAAPLLVGAGGAMIVALDGTVLLMAQPELRRAFGASAAQLQWTSTGYLVAVAALLVLAGRLGDRYGHLRLLHLGLTGFGLASAGIALAPSVGWVIGLRVAQGVCGALLQPATLAVLRLAYPERELRRAIAVRTGAIAVAPGAGPCSAGSWWRTSAGSRCSGSTFRWCSPWCSRPPRCGSRSGNAPSRDGSA
jgi:MFS family permease